MALKVCVLLVEMKMALSKRVIVQVSRSCNKSISGLKWLEWLHRKILRVNPNCYKGVEVMYSVFKVRWRWSNL